MSHVITKYVGNLQRRNSLRYSSNRAKDYDEGVVETFNYYHKPENIDELCSQTRFAKREVQYLYRNFKQQYPKGVINQQEFKLIFAQIFTTGRSDLYASLVFATLVKDNENQFIDFQKLVKFLSQITYGNRNDNVDWVFTLYDRDRDGFVLKNDLFQVAFAIYFLQNQILNPPTITRIIHHIDQIYEKMDTKKHGAVTREEFKAFCTQKKWDIIQSINTTVF